jgi:DNA-binding response OmpR family regulator
MQNHIKFKDGAKVVIVEDDRLLGELLARMLSEDGCIVKNIESGEQVLPSIVGDIPDLIYLDLLLPTMGGFEVLDQLKRNDKTKDIPVIILSCLGSMGEVKRGFNLGAVSYLIKNTVTPEAIIAEGARFVRC